MKSFFNVLPKICVSIILISTIFILKAVNCAASFVWINKSSGLAASNITYIAIDKRDAETIYVGSEGSLYKSADGGVSWSRIFNVPGNSIVNNIAVDHEDSRVIYIATAAGIFKSEDGGENWRSCPLGAGKDNVLTLSIGSGGGDLLLAGTEYDVFVSKDAGKNWMRSSTGLSAVNIRAIAQNYTECGILFAAADNGLFRSDDGAAAWKKVFAEDTADYEEGDEYIEEDLPISPTWIAADPFDPDMLYFATKRGIFKSDDSGSSWKRMTGEGLLSRNIRNLIVSPYVRGCIFAATEEGVFRFSDKENIWREFYSGLDEKDAVFIALDPEQDTLWLATKNGVYKSEGDIYEIKEIAPSDRAKSILMNFTDEPSYHEIQDVAIRYAEVHPEKISRWRKAAKTKALLPKLSFSVEEDRSSGIHWDAGTNPDVWVTGPKEKDTGWDITCSWDLGELIWNGDQTLIDVRSKLMVQLRDDVLDEVTHLYFERRRLQVELLQDPPEDEKVYVDKALRLEELTAGIDAMTGGYLTREIQNRKQK